MNTERRYVDAGRLEIRGGPAEGKPVAIRGYAAKFNLLSEDLGGFRERILPGAFSDVLGNDVRALFNHDPNHVLGRTTAQTLRLEEDGTGLVYEVDLPDTQAARDIAHLIERGDVSQSSFAFRVLRDGQLWKDEGGGVVREIKRVARLYDVSPVTYPAYPDATVGMRAHTEEAQEALSAWRVEQERAVRDALGQYEARARLAAAKARRR